MTLGAAANSITGVGDAGPANKGVRIALQFIALTAAFVLLNPHWYPDAAYYASSILRGPVTTSRSGHALWVPTAELITGTARAIGVSADPLLVLQIMTALGTAGLVMATYTLGLRMRLPRATALAGSSLLGLSATGLLMGGSGYASNVCAFGATIALAAIVKHEGDEWSARDGAVAVGALTLAWGAWALIVLAYPTIFLAAFLYSNGSTVRRLSRAVALCAAGGIASTFLAMIAWKAAPDTQGVSFLAWLQSASHNYVLDPVPLLDTLRSIFGLMRAFVELGSLGFAAKTYLLGDKDVVDGAALLRWTIALVVLALCAGAALLGLVLRAWRGDPVARRVGLLALVSALATVAFAVFYGGTELHMHATAMPLLCLAAVYGMGQVGSWLSRSNRAPIAAGWTFVAFVGGVNLFGTCLPDLADRGGLVTRLSASAAEHLRPGSVLVVTGQDFRGNLQGLVEYRSGSHVHNISAEVDQVGADEWARHLALQTDAAIERGAQVAVLSDLLGEPTPGGIQLSLREYPEPSMDEVARFFAGWQRSEGWSVDQFHFIILTPPDPAQAVSGEPR